MLRRHPVLFAALALAGVTQRMEEIRVPAFTAYVAPDPNSVRISEGRPVMPWAVAATSLLWFGHFPEAGSIAPTVLVRLPPGDALTLRLSLGSATRDARVLGTGDESRVSFGEMRIADSGYMRFELRTASGLAAPRAEVAALLLGGPAAQGAHFNLKDRRNAASVHLRFPIDSTWQVTGFYSEVTAVDDPVTTYYMATGFARGYFGMQVNSPTERRIIFSVWDAAEGATAANRSTVAAENHVQLLGKGDDVVASVFGNEGTGGHSHLVYAWKTGSVQRFFVTAEPHGTDTDYSGWWFHPERQEWVLIASFRAPKDGGYLRRLHSFSENFGGATGHLRRKALFGRQWVRLSGGEWRELTTAAFSHDVTGRADRFDRFMGIEGGQFFLSHGGYVEGRSNAGEAFTRAASGEPPRISLPGR